MNTTFAMTIDGRQVGTAKTEEIRNPANGTLVGLCPIADASHLEAAVQAARRAFASWSRLSDTARQDACSAVAKIIGDNAAELSVLLTLEQGKPLQGTGSEFELGGCVAWAAYTAKLQLPIEVLEHSADSHIELHRQPIGVVGSITPWNWPLMIAIWHIVPAIRAGNTVVIKPSPFTPLATLRLIELMNQVLPPGVVNVIAGGNDTGALLSQHPLIGKIVFTGSTATGRKVMASAAPTFKALTLELGGNDAGIILPDADIERIVEPLFWGAFINSGQTCGALKRLYVHDSLYDRTCEALVAYGSKVPMGDGMVRTNLLGPLQNEPQYRRVIELVEDAKARGGRVLLGGEPMPGPGYFYPVTFVADMQDGMRLVDEEQFGPALPIIRYTDVDDAVNRANASEYGLDASVWGGDPAVTRDIANRLEAGTVWINRHANIAPHVPMGGIKASGLGVEFGQDGLEAYTRIKVINASA